MFGPKIRSRSLLAFLLLIALAALLTFGGELSGEFEKVRQLSAHQRNTLNITRSEFGLLSNGVLLGIDLDNEGNDILIVKLGSNQTFGWRELIEPGKRIYRSERFLLDEVEFSFEVDVTVSHYDNQVLEIVDNTNASA